MTLAYWRGVLPATIARRLKVVRGCWLWTGATNAPWYSKGWGGGYGYVKLHGKVLRVHRVVWRAVGLRLTGRDWLLHRAGCPRTCVNPSHLRRGNNSENMTQMWAEGRH